jgi:hypothetical protein
MSSVHQSIEDVDSKVGKSEFTRKHPSSFMKIVPPRSLNNDGQRSTSNRRGAQKKNSPVNILGKIANYLSSPLSNIQ